MIRLEPRLVVELSADLISGFWHDSRLIRWRADKAPEDCTMEQIGRHLSFIRQVRLDLDDFGKFGLSRHERRSARRPCQVVISSSQDPLHRRCDAQKPAVDAVAGKQHQAGRQGHASSEIDVRSNWFATCGLRSKTELVRFQSLPS